MVANAAPKGLDAMAEEERERSLRLTWSGRFLAPIVAMTVYATLRALAPDLGEEGRATAAIGALMAVLWITEALPLPVTALIPVALFPLAGVLSISEATAPYASDVIFLFLGGFIIALAIERWGLHRRIAWWIIRMVGSRPSQITAGVMAATGFISMWISNTATTLMMLPIATSVINLVATQLAHRGNGNPVSTADAPSGATTSFAPRFATGLMLGTGYAASIGSVGTLIGTPPNLLMRGYLEETYGIVIGFGEWMLVGVPLAVVFMVLTWLLLTQVFFRPEIDRIPGGRELIAEELRRMGPMSRGERVAATIFVITAALWIGREPLQNWDWLVARVPAITGLTDAGIAVIAAIALFAIPVDVRNGVQAMDWETARRVPWNVLLLFGGGLSLAEGMQASGLDIWIGERVAGLGTLPPVVLVAIVCLVVTFLSELMSNTALAATFFPVVGGIAVASDIEPLMLVVPAALAATFAFMMPVGTPPNAIVFSSGYVTVKQMATTGIWLNVLGTALITLTTVTLAAWLLGGTGGTP